VSVSTQKWVQRTPLGAAIRRARRAADVTQRELADRLGVETITVSRWERGVTEPSVSMLVRIARELNTLAFMLVKDLW
jgi:transcriptional regulator with XRE-family HTH domain